MTAKPLVSVVLGSYNRKPFLKAVLESVRNNGMDFPYEIIVVDGGSTDGSLKYLAAQKDVIVIIQHNRGDFRGKRIERRSWGYFMNLGFKAAQGKYNLMISDDCLLVPGAINNGVALFEDGLNRGENIGAIAFYWRNWPIQDDYRVGSTYGKLFVNHGLFLRSSLADVGWVDEDSYKFYHADGDLCLKLWHMGYVVEDCKTAFVEHYHDVRATKISNTQDWEAYLTRWGAVFSRSPGTEVNSWTYLSYMDPHRTYQMFPHSRNRLGLYKGLCRKDRMILYWEEKQYRLFALQLRELLLKQPFFLVRCIVYETRHAIGSRCRRNTHKWLLGFGGPLEKLPMQDSGRHKCRIK